jgi:hypothetical protein
MRSLPFVVFAGLAVFAPATQAQPVEISPPAEDVTTDSEPVAQPIAAAVPIVSEPLPAIATGAPLRLEPPKKASVPRRPAPPAQPLAQARPR